MRVIKTVALLTFLCYFFSVSAFNNGANSLDSLIRVSKQAAKMDSAFFATYTNALNRFPADQTTRKFSYAQKGIVLAEKTKDNDLIALMTFQLGRYYGNIDSIRIALAMTKEAHSIAKDLNYKRRMAGWTAIYASFMSDYETAVEYYLEESKMCDAINRPDLKVSSYINMSELYLISNQLNKVQDYASKAYNLGLTTNQPRSVSYSSTLLGRVFQMRDQLDSARYYYEQGINSFRKQPSALSKEQFTYIRNHAYYHLSRFYRETGEKKKALLYADSSFLDFSLINDLQFEFSIQSYSNIAQCYLDLDRFGEAEAAIVNIENKIKSQTISFPLQQLYYEYKVNYAVKTNDYKSAYYYQEKLETIKDSIQEDNKANYLANFDKQGGKVGGERANLAADYNALSNKYRIAFTVAVLAIICLLASLLTNQLMRKKLET